MLSRVAENLYWMARYIERAENTARLINVNAFLLFDLPAGIAPGWQPIVAISGMDEAFSKRYTEYSERNCVKFLLGDSENPSSVIASLAAARENCRTVREILPRLIWEALTELYLFAKENAASGLTKKGRHAYLKGVIEGSQKISGILNSTLMRDEAYHFIRIGRHLERADMTSRILDVRTVNLLPEETPELRPFETIQWMSVLKTLTGYNAYRRKKQTRVQRKVVLSFLLQDSTFPRSVTFSLEALQHSLLTLKNNDLLLASVSRLLKKLATTDVGDLKQQELHSFIDELQLSFIRINQLLAETYFFRAKGRQGALA